MTFGILPHLNIIIDHIKTATPLCLAAEAGNLDAVECLLEHGAKVNVVGGNKMTAFGIARVGVYSISRIDAQGSRRLGSCLLDYGADPDPMVRLGYMDPIADTCNDVPYQDLLSEVLGPEYHDDGPEGPN